MQDKPPSDVALFGACLALTALFFTSCFGLARALEKCRPRPAGLTMCKANCKNLATALEMWASDHGGHYPPSLDALVYCNYLKTLPTCPAAGSDTYSATYGSRRKPDTFSFCCLGNNHARAYTGFSGSSDNYPRYKAELGLIDHP